MNLYKRLKDNQMVIDRKDFSELIYTRQIIIDNKRVDNPNMKLSDKKKYKATIGILTKSI